MVGYVDSHPPQPRRSRRVWWLLCCLIVGFALAGTAYCFLPASPPTHFLSPAEDPLRIGYPLVGEAIYSEPDYDTGSISRRAGHRSGKITYVIRNPESDRPIAIQFPATACYLEGGSNRYSPVDSGRWPEFAQQTETIVILPGESRSFVDSYHVWMHDGDTWQGLNYCFVFTTAQEASEQGDPYNGCLSFPVKCESPE